SSSAANAQSCYWTTERPTRTTCSCKASRMGSCCSNIFRPNMQRRDGFLECEFSVSKSFSFVRRHRSEFWITQRFLIGVRRAITGLLRAAPLVVIGHGADESLGQPLPDWGNFVEVSQAVPDRSH